MKSLKSKSFLISAAFVISYGCNTTQFAEAPRGKSAGSIEAVACNVSPQVVLPGEKVTITVTGASNYAGRFKQEIAGPGTVTSTLVKGANGYGLQSGQANEFSFDKQGNYTVNLSELDYNAGISASCKFKVFRECPVGSERIGANVAFIIDNSGSHGASDCPGATEVKADNGQISYKCNAETNREKAVNFAVQMLKTAGQAGGKASSHVSTAIFPQKDKVSSGFVIGKSGWIDSTNSTSGIKDDLKLLRSPAGLTPYGEGLEAAKVLFSSTPDTSKKKVVIFVTDGYPTDQDPYISLQKASASGAKIITVMVSSGDKGTLIDTHKQKLRSYGDNTNPWHASAYGSYDEYFTDLLGDSSSQGLLEKMSDQVVNVSKTSELKNVFESLIEEKALSCE
jgi:hypothetical protein